MWAPHPSNKDKTAACGTDGSCDANAVVKCWICLMLVSPISTAIFELLNFLRHELSVRLPSSPQAGILPEKEREKGGFGKNLNRSGGFPDVLS